MEKRQRLAALEAEASALRNSIRTDEAKQAGCYVEVGAVGVYDNHIDDPKHFLVTHHYFNHHWLCYTVTPLNCTWHTQSLEAWCLKPAYPSLEAYQATLTSGNP